MFAKLGLKPSLYISYVVAIVGMLCIVVLKKVSNEYLLALFVLGSKMGVTFNFTNAFLANNLLFPMNILSTSYGICNMFSRFFTIPAPYAAEVKPEAISEWLFVGMNTLGILFAFLIRIPKKRTLLDFIK